MKLCTKCRRDKPDELFVASFNTCTPCRERNRNYRKVVFDKAKLSGGKFCQKCGKPSPPEGFPLSRLGRPGSRCPTCQDALKRYYIKHKTELRIKAQKYYKTPEAQVLWAKNNKIKMEKFYGLKPNQKEEMYEQQKGICSICLKYFDSLAVDHNHDTGQIRELLCKPCNLGLGNFLENTQSLQNAIEYLNRWSNSSVSSN